MESKRNGRSRIGWAQLIEELKIFSDIPALGYLWGICSTFQPGIHPFGQSCFQSFLYNSFFFLGYLVGFLHGSFLCLANNSLTMLTFDYSLYKLSPLLFSCHPFWSRCVFILYFFYSAMHLIYYFAKNIYKEIWLIILLCYMA